MVDAIWARAAESARCCRWAAWVLGLSLIASALQAAAALLLAALAEGAYRLVTGG